MTSSSVLLWVLGVHFVARQCLTSIVASKSRFAGQVTYLAGRDSIAILWTGYSVILAIVLWRVGHGPGGATQAIGYLVLLAATLLRCFGLIALRGFYFATTAVAERHVVIRSGPFRWLRHPLYLGLAVELAGLAVLAQSTPVTVVSAVLILEIHRHVRREQRLLTIHLGREYLEFSEATWDITDLSLVSMISDVWEHARARGQVPAPLSDLSHLQ